jgi:Flp pilus assembly protein CpaB
MRINVKVVATLACLFLPQVFSQGQWIIRKGILDGALNPRTLEVVIAVTTIEPKVLPGSLVDVVQSIRKDKQKNEEKIVMENLKLRAIDITQVKADPNDRQRPQPTVTLDVTPEQALKLFDIKDKGPITIRMHQPAAAGKKGGEPPKQQDDGAKAGEKKKEAKLPPGMERFSLSLGPGQVEGGFVFCGYFVDISYQTDGGGKKISRTVAENVMVRSVDGTCNLYGDAPPDNVVTLMGTKEQFQTLNSLKCNQIVLTVRIDDFNSKGEFIRLPP